MYPRWLAAALLLSACAGGNEPDDDGGLELPDSEVRADAEAPPSDFGPGNPLFGECWDAERGCLELRQIGAGGPMPPDAGGRFWVRREGGGADAELCFVEDAMVALFLTGWETADCATGPCEDRITRDVRCAELPEPASSDCGFDAANGVFACNATDPLPLEASAERTDEGLEFCVGDPMAACETEEAQTCCNYARGERARVCRDEGRFSSRMTICGIGPPPTP